MRTTLEILTAARSAKSALSCLDDKRLTEGLLAMADALDGATHRVLAANALDVEAATGSISEVMIDRLRLDATRVHAMGEGIRAVAALPSPLGRLLEQTRRPNGLIIKKTSVAMGVIAVIYESRPNVTSDAAALCLKSGNVAVLRGGKEAFRSSYAIIEAMKEGLLAAGICADAISLIEDTTRESATALMKARGYVDLLIPRGGAGLIRACVENACVPVLETGTGICHIYADKSCDVDLALSVINNAKTSRPSVCNAMEVLLVHKDVAPELLPRLEYELVEKRAEKGLTPVELRLDENAQKLCTGTPAEAKDFDTEFLDYVLAVKVVSDLREAIEHINTHSTKHSESILTRDEASAELFTTLVDSSSVYVNASTRFTDGGEFGFGCEIGISTQKLHARGPVGLRELTTYKYVIIGNGQVR